MRHERDGDVFELAVDGMLGPVLRSTLRPNDVDAPQSFTTIRVVSDDPDISGLVARIQARGLLIDGVWRLPAGGDGP
jgi:hypothetical protein